MPDELAFFMHRQLSGEDYDLSGVFGPTDDNRFNHGITLSFNNPDAWVLHAVTAGIVSYDDDAQQLRLTEKLRFTEPRPWPKANAFEHVSAFVYQGVNLDFDFDYASATDESLLKRAYDEWAEYDTQYPSGYIYPFHYMHPVTRKPTSEARRNAKLKLKPSPFKSWGT